MPVFFLGPKGSYTHQAAKVFGGSDVDLQSLSDIHAIFESIKLATDFGVVPIENSTEGSVNQTQDCLMTHGVKILGEKTLCIHHALLMQKSGELQNLKVLLSHEQSFAQCRQHLLRHFPGVYCYPVSSNAKAAELLCNPSLLFQLLSSFLPDSCGPLSIENMGMIGPELLADLYELKMMKNAIQDTDNNRTRFIKIGKEDQGTSPSGHDKTSFVFSTHKDQPGSLCDVLLLFSSAKLNLNKIVSRPAKTTLGEYVFFIDCDGHIKDPILGRVYKEMAFKTSFLNCLGSYPKEKEC